MNEKFITIKIKESTGIRFRTFCRRISKKQSESLELMLNFFIENKISPLDSFGPAVNSLEALIKKRVNGLVAILKNIEKQQTLPTKTMMQLLFEGAPTKKKQILIEKKSVQKENSPSNNSQDKYTYYIKQLESLTKQNNNLKTDLRKIINNGTYVNNTFGKGYFRVELSKEEYEKINLNLKNVYHNYSTKTR